MIVWVLDYYWRNVYTIDSYESLIWTEAYIGAGDFELVVPINKENVEIATFLRTQRIKLQDVFFTIPESEQIMIFEQLEMRTDAERGSKIMITGRSMETLLERRIIWNQTSVNGSLHDGVKKLINENVSNPEIQYRRIEQFWFVDSTDPKVTGIKIDKQWTGDNLYTAINEQCTLYDIGFRVTVNTEHEYRKEIRFRLYAGADRSYDQTENPYVVFSPNFENLVTSSLLEDISQYKTVTLVAGEDEGHNRRTLIVNDTNPNLKYPGGNDLVRRELYTDARDIQSETYDEEGNKHNVPDDVYFGYLRNRGEEKLSENKFINEFEGEVETQQMFQYGKDFNIGDIVQIQTDYNVESKMRIMKMVRSYDDTGYKAYPVFKILE